MLNCEISPLKQATRQKSIRQFISPYQDKKIDFQLHRSSSEEEEEGEIPNEME